ncbi:MAG: hypothetical protein U0525_01950 [Patescibacteria group bacterium]
MMLEAKCENCKYFSVNGSQDFDLSLVAVNLEMTQLDAAGVKAREGGSKPPYQGKCGAVYMRGSETIHPITFGVFDNLPCVAFDENHRQLFETK